jgi:hypothetical protein
MSTALSAYQLEPWTLSAAQSACLLHGASAGEQPEVLKAALLELAVRGVLHFEPLPKRRFHEQEIEVTLVGEAPNDPPLLAVVGVLESLLQTLGFDRSEPIALKAFGQKLATTYAHGSYVRHEVAPELEAAGLMAESPFRFLGFAFGSRIALTDEGSARRAELQRWLSVLKSTPRNGSDLPSDLLARAGSAPLLLTPKEELERWIRPHADGSFVAVGGGTDGSAEHHGGHGHGHSDAGTLDLGSLHALDSADLGNIVGAVHAVHHSVDAGHAGGHGGGHDGGGGHGGGGHGG